MITETIHVDSLFAINDGGHTLTSGTLDMDLPRRGTIRMDELKLDIAIDPAAQHAMIAAMQLAARSITDAQPVTDQRIPKLPPGACGLLASFAPTFLPYTPEPERAFRIDTADRIRFPYALLTDSSTSWMLSDLRIPRPHRPISPRRAARRRHHRALKRR